MKQTPIDPAATFGPYCPWPRVNRKTRKTALKVSGIAVAAGTIAHCVPPLLF